MANNVYTYFSDTETEKLVDKEINSIKYISRKSFKKAVQNGLKHSICGRTELKSTENSKDSNTGILIAGDHRYIIDSYKYSSVKGYIPVGNDTYIEYAGTNWLLLLFPAALLLAAIIAIICFFHSPDNPILIPDQPSPTPEASSEVEEESEDFVLYIELPDGNSHFDGTVAEPENAGSDAAEDASVYNGQADYTVTMVANGTAHVIVDNNADVEKGELPDFELDFTILDFEIGSGIYNGIMEITYPDGTVSEKTVRIIVTEANGGTMEIGFSSNVAIDLNSGSITCRLETDRYDTHQTVVELVLVNGGQEYVLATSSTLNPGDVLTSMTLDKQIKKQLTTGQYSGYMRLSFYSDNNEDAAASVQTNVDVNITVQ